jgi:hypothetical protein
MTEFFTTWTNYLMIIPLIISVYAIIQINRTRRRFLEREIVESHPFIRAKMEMESKKRRYKISPYVPEIRNRIIHDDSFYGGEISPKYELESKENIKSEKKKERFLNIANISFHFADKERIKTFYDDYFKEPTIMNLITESITENDSGIKASIPSILESKIGGKDLSKWISNIKLPDITENGMFKRYQNETIQKNQVQLGLEEDDIELSVLSEFEEQVQDFSDEFEFKFDHDVVEVQKTKLKEKAAERTLKSLEKANGWVLIEGNFLIQKENDEFYKVTMKHPVSNYLASGKEVLLSCLVPISKIEPSVAGNYTNSVNKSIPIKIYGQVWQPINRNENIWELIITPLAMY